MSDPRFGDRPVVSITTAEIEQWMGVLIADSASPSSPKRYLATSGTPPGGSTRRWVGQAVSRRSLRSLLNHRGR